MKVLRQTKWHIKEKLILRANEFATLSFKKNNNKHESKQKHTKHKKQESFVESMKLKRVAASEKNKTRLLTITLARVVSCCVVTP